MDLKEFRHAIELNNLSVRCFRRNRTSGLVGSQLAVGCPVSATVRQSSTVLESD